MSEMNELLESLKAGFDEYKKANDERLGELSKTSGQAAELEGKLAKIEEELQKREARLSELEAKANRPQMGGGAFDDPATAERKAAFDKYVRKGLDADLRALETKDDPIAVQTGVNAQGGYAVPTDLYREIFTLLGADSPMRAVCDVRVVGNPNIVQLVDVGGTTTGWVGETSSRTQTNTPQLTQVTPTWGEIYAFPFSSQWALDDIYFNVEDWLINNIAREFAKQENIAFTTGNGSNKPKGLLAADMNTTADDSRAYGYFQYIKTGVADGMPATSAAFGDLLIDTVTALKSRYYSRARWMMTRQTLAAVRKLKDSNNNYLWQPGLQSGEPNTILGFPYTYNDDMPQIGANALPIAFGDFREAYVIMDRTGIYVRRDDLTNKPWVGFYTTKRVGNMILNSEAVKFIKCETSGGGGGGSKTDPTITLSASTATVTAGSTTTVTYTTNSDGVASVSSSAEAAATADVSDGTITITGVAEGTATITLSIAASDTYNAATKTIATTVNAAAGGGGGCY